MTNSSRRSSLASVLLRRRSVFVHECVVIAELALLEKRQNQQTQTGSTESDCDECPCSSDIGSATLTRLAFETALLGVQVVVLRHLPTFC